jgi:hypothetical protein
VHPAVEQRMLETVKLWLDRTLSPAHIVVMTIWVGPGPCVVAPFEGVVLADAIAR